MRFAGGWSVPAVSGTIVSTPTTVASVGLVSTASRANRSHGATSLAAGRLEPDDRVGLEREVRARPPQAGADGHRVEGPFGEGVGHEDLGAAVALETPGHGRLDREVVAHVGDPVLVEGHLDAGARRHGRGPVTGDRAQDVQGRADAEGPRCGQGPVRGPECEVVLDPGCEPAPGRDGRGPRVGSGRHGQIRLGVHAEAGGHRHGGLAGLARQRESRVGRDARLVDRACLERGDRSEGGQLHALPGLVGALGGGGGRAPAESPRGDRR